MSKGSKLRALVTEAFATLADRNGGRIEKDAVIAWAIAALGATDQAALIREAAESAFAYVDTQKAQQATSTQTLLWGDEDALDGFFSVGGESRVRVRNAVHSDWLRRLEMQNENVRAVTATRDETIAVLAQLGPYFRAPSTQTEAALRDYLNANPDAQAAD